MENLMEGSAWRRPRRKTGYEAVSLPDLYFMRVIDLAGVIDRLVIIHNQYSVGYSCFFEGHS